MKTLLVYVTLLLTGIGILSAFLHAIDRDMAYREMALIERKVEQCGEGYRDRHKSAVARAVAIDGYILHLADCRVIVVRDF